MTELFLGTPVWMWGVFMTLVVVLLALDLGVLNKGDKEISAKRSLTIYTFYIAMAVAFGGWIWMEKGAESAMTYYTGYVIEQSLSMDNLFVMALIFGFFRIPRAYQHRVLFWGILGVIVLRGIMIGVGAALVAEFHWLLYIFSAFLIYSGFKMLKTDHDSIDIEHNPILNFLKKHFRVSNQIHGHDFTVKETDASGKVVTAITPLFVALIMIECADVIFAVDSVPAIFALTQDTYIIYTSNIFAILGLRTLYFALSAMMERFEYLKYALAAVLIFIGSKIFITEFMLDEGQKFPSSVSLSITFGLLGAGVAYSLWKTRKRV